MFTGLAAATLGGISALGASALSNVLGRRNAEAAADYGADVSKSLASWKARNLPKLEREGLEAAGINPLLAYGSIGSGSMPTLSVDSSYTPRFDGVADALSRLPESASARELRAEQVASLKADRSKVNAEEDLLRAQAQEVRSRIPRNEEQAQHLRDERGGVLNIYGVKVPVNEVVRKLAAFGEFMGSSARQIGHQFFGLTGDETSHLAPFVRPPKAPKAPKAPKPKKAGADASWIPAGGSSARDMLKKRMKQF